MGIVSPVGPDAESSWQALLAGRSGVAATAGIDVTDWPVRIAAQVPDLDVAAMLGVRQTRALDRFAQLAVIAAREAVISAGWELTGGPRWSTVIGTGFGGVETFEQVCPTTACAAGTDAVGLGADLSGWVEPTSYWLVAPRLP